MNLALIEKREEIISNKKLTKAYSKINKLIKALNEKDIPVKVMSTLNEDLERLNLYNEMELDLVSEKELTKEMNKVYKKILKFLQKNLKMVPKHYYRSLWMTLGMSTFGVPIGLAYSAALGNFGFIGIGIGMGMVLGMAFGSKMDQKAAKKGKQLNLEMNI